MRKALAAVFFLAVACKPSTPVKPIITVAAASDLTNAFSRVGAAFTKQTGIEVTFSFGASGMMAKQIAEGAPFDLFAAANAEFVDAAIKSGACDQASRAAYAHGRVVVATLRSDGGLHVVALADLADAKFRRIAIANPDRAPYGRAATEALAAAHLTEATKSRLILADNVRHALQLVETGNADVALTALSLTQDNPQLDTLLIDDQLHAPIEQTLVVCKRGKNTAGGRAFADFVRSDEGHAVLAHSGLYK